MVPALVSTAYKLNTSNLSFRVYKARINSRCVRAGAPVFFFLLLLPPQA